MKIELAYGLMLDGKSEAIRRVDIYKVETKNKELWLLRLLIIKYLAKQILVKLALELNGRRFLLPILRDLGHCQDAISALFLSMIGKTRFVLDVKIRKCFDQIDQDKLITKLDTFD